jgi:hypothetical protein
MLDVFPGDGVARGVNLVKRLKRPLLVADFNL